MSGAIGGVISSVAEGVDALGKSVKNAVEGDWEEAGKEFGRVGLEAAGLAGAAFAGPAAETIQEGIEGVLDSAGLEGGTGDAPAPDGGGGDFNIPEMLSGGLEGALGSIGGGGAGGALGNILGAVGGGGSAAGGLQELLGGVMGGDQMGDFVGQMGDFGEAAGLMEGLGQGGSKVADQMLSASV